MDDLRDSKYLVIKKSDWAALQERLYRKGGRKYYADVFVEVEALELPDARVIRLQDHFSPPAFDMYAAAIDLAHSLVDHTSPENGVVAKRLREIADYFHQSAHYAWQLVRKLPD
jgi:hypothetical protein